MKNNEIIVSNYYIIKLRSQKLGVVIISRTGEKAHTWYATNIATNRDIFIRSSRRILRLATIGEIRAAQAKKPLPKMPPILRIPNPPPGRGLYSDLANAQNDVQDTYNQMRQYILELATRKRLVNDTTLQIVAGMHRELSLRLLGHLNTIMAICNAPADPPNSIVRQPPKEGLETSVDAPAYSKDWPYPMDWPYPIGPCYSTNEWEALVKAWENGQEERDREEERMAHWDD